MFFSLVMTLGSKLRTIFQHFLIFVGIMLKSKYFLIPNLLIKKKNPFSFLICQVLLLFLLVISSDIY